MYNPVESKFCRLSFTPTHFYVLVSVWLTEYSIAQSKYYIKYFYLLSLRLFATFIIMEEHFYRCTTCGSVENLHKSVRRVNKILGDVKVYYMCRDCKAARLRDYRATEDGKASVDRTRRKYEATHPDRVKAWREVARHKLRLKSPCEICGKAPAHAHHPDIKKPLFVIYLCPYHHKAAHKAQNDTISS